MRKLQQISVAAIVAAAKLSPDKSKEIALGYAADGKLTAKENRFHSLVLI